MATLYTLQYKSILEAVFGARAAFARALAPIQLETGVENSKKAFSVKTSGVPVVINEYSTGTNDVFGDASGKKNRFGNMTEVIYEDKEAEYSYDLAIREGLDRHTVNNNLQVAIADRLRLHAEAQTRRIGQDIGKFISAAAGETKTLAAIDEASLIKLFNQATTYFTDNDVMADVTAYVRQEIYNAIVDMVSTTAGKGSSVSLDENNVLRYKGFTIQEEGKRNFASGDIAYFVPDKTVIPFVGIETARTIEAHDFDGVELQAAAKGGQFVLEENKRAIIKVTGTIVDA